MHHCGRSTLATVVVLQQLCSNSSTLSTDALVVSGYWVKLHLSSAPALSHCSSVTWQEYAGSGSIITSTIRTGCSIRAVAL
eukprot:9479681-Pyramimonas_sp.AAC.1